MRYLRYVCLVCALLALFSAPAFSSTTQYVDYTSWLNATDSGYAIVNFEGLTASGTSKSYLDTTGLQLPSGTGPVFELNGGSGYDVNVMNKPGTNYDFGTGAELANLNTTYFLHVLLPVNIRSIAFDVFSYSATASETYTAIVNGNSYTLTANLPNPNKTGNPTNYGFFGFTSDIAISSIDLQVSGGSYEFLDNFRYGDATPLPPGNEDLAQEPEICTFLMIGSGLFLLARWRRRNRRAPALPA